MKQIKFFGYYKVSYFLLVLMLLMFGCTYNYKQPIQDLNLSPVNKKIDLSIGYIITEEFLQTTWKKNYMGDTFILPIGNNLSNHADQLMKNVFSNPVRLEENAINQEKLKVNYIMKPKVVHLGFSRGLADYERTSLGIEWQLSDLSGRQIWVDVFKGEGVGGVDDSILVRAKGYNERMQMALQESFEKAQKTMLSSKVLNKLE